MLRAIRFIHYFYAIIAATTLYSMKETTHLLLRNGDSDTSRYANTIGPIASMMLVQMVREIGYQSLYKKICNHNFRKTTVCSSRRGCVNWHEPIPFTLYRNVCETEKSDLSRAVFERIAEIKKNIYNTKNSETAEHPRYLDPSTTFKLTDDPAVVMCIASFYHKAELLHHLERAEWVTAHSCKI